MTLSILLVKETRAGEQRVALIPADVATLVQAGHIVHVEATAGAAAGFADAAYVQAGATLRTLKDETLATYQALFADINLIVRAKRPNRNREILENQAIPEGISMIGALDPFEKNSTHMQEYQHKKLKTHSLDQLPLEVSNPMNLLAAMSKIAGKLAIQDALKHITYPAKTAVIIGFGVVGRAALEEAIHQGLSCSVFVTNAGQLQEIEQLGARALLLDKHAALATQQAQIKALAQTADIVLTSARRANQPAPLLIPSDTLNQMKPGAVIVDMALSEGGNVEGAHHDQTLVLGNQVIVTNVSGYPKKMPHQASILWSQATRLFIETL